MTKNNQQMKVIVGPYGLWVDLKRTVLVLAFASKEDANEFAEDNDLPLNVQPYEPTEPVHVTNPWLLDLPLKDGWGAWWGGVKLPMPPKP